MRSVAFDQHPGRLNPVCHFETETGAREVLCFALFLTEVGTTSAVSNNNNTWLSSEIYEDIRRRLVSQLRGSRDEIEDAFHEALIAVFNTVDRGERPAAPQNVEAYLVVATKRKLIDAVRKNASNTRKHDDFAADSEAQQTTADDSPESLAISVERSACFQLLFDCLRGEVRSDIDENLAKAFVQVQTDLAQRLSNEHWIVLRTRGLKGKGFKTCAAVMQCSLGTAHNRWNEAIETIKSVFARHNLDPGASTL